MALSARRLLLSSANKVRWYSSQTPGKAYVVGVGMTKFEKPKGEAGRDFPEMAFEAGKKALDDARIDYNQIEQAVTGYVFGDSTKGQRAVYELGKTGIPVYNTNNNCSTGASALYLAKQLVSGRVADCVLALGFEKMQKGSLNLAGEPGANPLDLHMSQMTKFHGGPTKAPAAPWIFGMGGQHHMKLYGTTKEQFARVAEKNHRHSVNNPYAQFQDVYSLDEILASKEIFGPITKLQCSPTSDGAAAAIIASERFVKDHKLEDQAVEIAAMKMATDLPECFDDPIGICGIPMARKAAAAVYDEAGVTPNDVDVIELHDCFSTNELMTYEALGLCDAGQGGRLIDEGQVTYGGKWVVNPSGGLISKGHPLGATGLAQCAELCWQLRGQADKRQVSGAKIGMQHNLGLGGAAVCTIFKR